MAGTLTYEDHAVEQTRTRLQQIYETDAAVKNIGIQLGEITSEHVCLTLEIRPEMANGHGICHGGYLFMLADSALAYCCAANGSTIVTRNAGITFIAPAKVGRVITAQALVRTKFGRNSICEVTLVDGDTTIAHFTGQGTTFTNSTESRE